MPFVMTPVQSSFIAEVGWNEEEKSAKVIFNDGYEATTTDMDEAEVRQWISSPSAGKFWHQRAKQYNWSRS